MIKANYPPSPGMSITVDKNFSHIHRRFEIRNLDIAPIDHQRAGACMIIEKSKCRDV